ncbi:MAG: histidinol-phosphate transaminase [Proteobacteria bacterium]|nr:histidinol-phosphate transaminase [Pseudomonadota bacterium]
MKVGSHIEKLIPYIPGKPVEELERELGIKSAVKLASNENPLGPSKKGIAMMKKYINSLHRYPEGGCYYLAKKLSEKIKVPMENIMFGNGSNEVLEIIGRTFYESGDEIIFSQYAFIVYKLVAQALGAKYYEVPAKGLAHDLDKIGEHITKKTKIIYLANPNNPTGTMFGRKEFEGFMKKVPENILVVLDEAYSEYVEDKNYPDGLSYLKRYKNLIVVRTFSKIYGLAGLRVGYAVAEKGIIDYMNRVREPFNVNTLAQFAALGALDDEDHIKRTKDLTKEGLEYLYKEFKKLKIDYEKSYGNFVLMKSPVNSMELYNKLLKEGVIVRPVGGYGLPEYLRVSVGLMEENKKFIKALKKILKN